MIFWKSVVGKLWMTIIGLVALVLLFLGMFIIDYIDTNFANSNDVKRLFVYTAVIGFLLTTFFAFFLSTRITQPLVELRNAAVAITKGDYRPRVYIHSSDEIGQLAQAFNHMASVMDETIRDLQHEKDRLGSILRSMTDAVITVNSDGEIVLANPQGEMILKEWEHIDWDQEVEHEGIKMNSTSTPDSKTKIPLPLTSLYNSVVAGAQEQTTKIHVKNGVWSVVMTPLYSGKTLRGAVAVLRDVTVEHTLDKLRKDFVANVSHELRTPLSLMQGYSEALLDDIAGSVEERRELAQIIHDESLRMGRLVQDLLDLSKMETGHLELSLGRLDVGSFVSRIYRKFQSVVKENELQFHLEVEEPLVLNAVDEDRLEQVLINLIDNAIRHSEPQSKIVLSAQRIQEDGKEYVLFKVQDEGEGISPEDLPYIFERFYKADKARTRGTHNERSGTGLGLSIVKNIVEAHEGTIHVESKVGVGTTFSVMLPC